MATSGKKQKKNKWKSIDPSIILNSSALPVKPVSWAEAVEDEAREQLFTAKPAREIVLPSAPRASIDEEVYERTVPHEGPFMAYLSNLSFDIIEEDVYEFFQDLKVARVDLPRDDRSGNGGRCKGYGHVEFENRADLISALGFIDASIKGRRVRIDLPDAQDERQRGGVGERRQYRDRNQDRDRGSEDPERTSGDWRSAPRAEVEERRRPYGGRDSYNRDRDDRDGGPRRGGGFRSEDAPAVMTRDDFGTAKPTPLPERERAPRSEGRGFTDRSGGGGRMFDRTEMKDPSAAGSSPERERREFVPRGGDREHQEGGRSFDRSEMKDRGRSFDRTDMKERGRSFDRSEMKDPSFRDQPEERGHSRTRGDRDRDSGRTFDRTEMREPPARDPTPPPSEQPKTRPKLNLAPRTKPIETPAPPPQPPPAPPPPTPPPPPPPTPPPPPPPVFFFFFFFACFILKLRNCNIIILKQKIGGKNQTLVQTLRVRLSIIG
uniref:Eukaryotic translation initiation factor 4B n=1 Tax=Cacopsylla melanoneura TaxID=428564 RepID=A0A8D8UH87_9HEMI